MLTQSRMRAVPAAIAWIVLYVVTNSVLRGFGEDSWQLCLGLAALTTLIALFVVRLNMADELGLTHWVRDQRRLLYLVPLWAVSSVNLWGGVSPHYAGGALACAVASMVMVGILEETIFRGLLLHAMLRENSATCSIVVCAVTFGVGHIVNLAHGQALTETLVQIGYAIALGFVFTLVTLRGASLLPAMLSHAIIDVTSLFSTLSDAAGTLDLVVAIACLAVSACYAVYLWRLEA